MDLSEAPHDQCTEDHRRAGDGYPVAAIIAILRTPETKGTDLEQ
jgi:hypothetical protein